MTRLFVNIRCEKCGKAHGVTNEGAYLNAPDVVKGICMNCQVEQLLKEREAREKETD